MLVEMTLWTYLLLLSVGVIWTLIEIYKPSQRKLWNMLKMGLFLAVFDWVFETAGLFLGYWKSQGSVLFLGPAVPLEVFLIATCAGAAMNLLFPKFSWRFAVPAAMLIASAGAGIEYLLTRTAPFSSLVYMGGWTSWLAYVSYFLVFLFLQYANDFIEKGGAQGKGKQRK